VDEALIAEREANKLAISLREEAVAAAKVAKKERREAVHAEKERDTDKSVQQLLREALTANATRVSDLFRDWDHDGNGTISKREFRGAVVALGYQAPREEVDKLFDSLDEDRSGLMDYRELARVLRRGAGSDIALDKELQVGEVAFETSAKNKIGLREHARDGAKARSGLVATVPALREAMQQDLVRVVDLMRALDADEDGTVTKEEFHKVLPLLGFDAEGSAQAIDELFDTLDADGGGTIDYEELHAKLRTALKG